MDITLKKQPHFSLNSKFLLTNQDFLYELFQKCTVKQLCEPKRVLIFQGYLNFNIGDVTTSVADITLCELLPIIEDKSASL